MSFGRVKAATAGPLLVRVPLPPRSLQVLSREARYGYTHAIDLDDIVDARRVSITFRHSANPSNSGASLSL